MPIPVPVKTIVNLETPAPKFPDPIISDRPTRDDINRARKEGRMVISFQEWPDCVDPKAARIDQRLEYWKDGWLRGLGLGYSEYLVLNILVPGLNKDKVIEEWLVEWDKEVTKELGKTMFKGEFNFNVGQD